MTATVGASATAQVHKSHLRTLIGTGIGNAVEWYDWAIYATFSPFIASALFSSADPTSAVLSTLAIFAVGFVARPFGGFVFGWIGDRIGRKTSMTIAVGLAAVGSLLIGIAPTFQAVGALASVMLLVARLIQGLAHGGELPSSQTYLSEMAPKEKRGFWATLIYTSGTAGILAGTLLGAILTGVLSKADMNAWGWRIPFLVGGALGIYALVMRAKMKETEAFQAEAPKEKREPMWPQIVKYRKQALQVIGLTVGLTVVYYIWGVVAPSYAASSLKMDRGAALWSGVIGNVAFIASLPFWGKLSDRIGRKPVLIVSSAGAALLHFPMTWLLKDSPWQLAVSMSVMLFFIAGSASIVPAVYAELFPTKIRTVGVGVPYSICVAVFGGTAPYLQTWLGSIGQANMFNVYAVILLAIGIAFAFMIPETKGKDLTH
ncbi:MULTISPECIES: MFS transporter [Arthrobacter]|uniref:MHS family alpha-ketoglutarate permease-like MFS transporter n=1 Tax=Arthrobacter bambusae TaxID=1338426 RepID=A0AAW8DDS0_9MICC|nr:MULTISPECIES: MFS transporter [Arthrobacter]MDP9905855.1 MHS family alpha-ketoglutarate permease-like MFS transporter [Arthrobacter bambusae]MDQ0130442.1 MHS family alpha-ketoglutarate permease-like MFS transporter [Arthrobacter bambusae]MDQ0181637.1 MHS family alpha-ketoglutarate permease-like MFS transporter [Arthrobacter bambusae]